MPRLTRVFAVHKSNIIIMRKPAFAYAKTKTQISCAGTAQLISAFVFAKQIVQSLYFLYPKFQAYSNLLWLYSPVCVGPGQKPRRPVFSERGSYLHCLPFSLNLLGDILLLYYKRLICLKLRRIIFGVLMCLT